MNHSSSTHCSSSTPFIDAHRDSTSLLVAAERRCLLWLAARLPRWIHSDHLTGLALLAMAAAGACCWAARLNRRWLVGVVVCLAANWFGDSLDGTVARVRHQQRPRYGFYVDHVVDCFGVLFLFGGLALSGFMNPIVAMGVLVAYFMLSIEIYLATYSLGVFKLSFAGIGPTELRVILAGGALALMGDPHVGVLGGTFKLFDVGGVVAIAGIGATLLVSLTSHVRALYRAEPIPPAVCEPRTIAAESAESAGVGGVAGKKSQRLVSDCRRWLTFNLVGAIGFAVQLGLVWTLTDVWGINYLVATLVAVEVAILHNFCWHSAWTWSDRDAGARQILVRLVRFNLTTGAVSIAGNVAVTAALVGFFRLHYFAANVIAIAACSSATFLLSHRFVFARALCLLAVVLTAGSAAHAADLSPGAVAAFDHDARQVETRLDEERAGRAPFLRLDRLPAAQQHDARARLVRGEIVVERMPSANADSALPGAMLHHWLATALVAGVSLDRVVWLMQSYSKYPDVYRPAVQRARVIARDGDTFTVALQLFAKKVISVTLNTEQRVAYLPVGRFRMQVRSVSTRIAELRDPGQAAEREAPIGHDSGFLWRFNNYCALDQRVEGTVEGTYVQCESLSLTRETPFGLGWLVGPFLASIPRESLELTLGAMRMALASPGDAPVLPGK